MSEILSGFSHVHHSPFISAAFHPFSTQHLITLGVILALGILIVLVAGGGGSSRRKWLGPLMGFILLGYAAAVYAQQAIEHLLNWEYSLPLDLCNLVLISCVISLFRPSQSATEIAYFWGLGGVLQATLTPDLARGFPSWDFTLFFWGHGATLLAIIFLISSREFRPRKRSVLRMMTALNAYALVVGIVDAITGWNYGYLCRKPSMPSLLDLMGPWPWYLLSMEGIALLIFFILDLPWRLWAPARGQNQTWTPGDSGSL